MIDEENDTVSYAEVTEELDISKISDSSTSAKDENNPLNKKRARRSLSELRTPRQKFCARWQIEFPWLKANRVDESVGYCTICRKELVCKKSHLERHQKSFKHVRLQGFENVFTVNMRETELVEAHTSGYIETDNEYQEESVLEEEGLEYTTIKVEPLVMVRQDLQASPKKRTQAEKAPTPVPKPIVERNVRESTSVDYVPRLIEKPRDVEHHRKHEQPIEPERPQEMQARPRDLNDYYYMARAPAPVPPQPPPKDSFDLFFESISATVKALPPKLAAEVKSQVSQLIANFELRAICEKEAQEKAAAESAALSTQVGNVIAVNPAMNAISSSSELTTSIGHQQQIGGQAVAHYVYSYQSK